MNENEYNINAHDNYPDSDQKIEIPTMKILPLKKICMTIGELPTSYLETMTYYEMLVWFIEYLKNNIIPTINNNAEAVQEVQTLVMNLQNYINNFKDSIDQDIEDLEEYMNNYFENLDVQEEINNKLDDMIEQGTLQEIIASYLNSKAIFGFDTVASMKEATNLIDGSYAKTLGYYSKNDGGSALYKIREITESDTIDEAYIIEISDNLIAELIIENNKLNVLQLGIKRNDNTYNAHDLILYTVQNYDVELYFPTGNYYTSQLFFDKNCHVNLKGDSTCYEYKSIINPYGSNNGYILKCGGKENYSVDDLSDYTINQLKNIKINNLTFSDWSNNISSSKYNYTCCLAIDNCQNIELNVNFYFCKCNGLLIRESWELQSNFITCRGMFGTFDTCGILFANRAMTNSGSNITALMFDLLDFEQINGKCIVTERNANCSNIAINKISIENGRGTNPDLLSVKVANITTDELNTYRSTYHFNPLLTFTGSAITIGSINTGYVGTCYYYRDGVSADGKWTDALLSVQGDIAISTIGMPSLMIAILTKAFSDIFENVTISSFTTNPGEQFSAVGRKVAQFVYIIPEELGSRNSCTFVDIQDKKIIKDPDYIKTFGNGFWSGTDLFQFFIPHKSWQNYALVDNKICYNVFSISNVGGFINKIYIPSGKKLRLHMKVSERMVGDSAPLQLLDNTDTVIETINSGINDWQPDTWYTVEYTITSTSYSRLKLSLVKPSVIEWVEIC